MQTEEKTDEVISKIQHLSIEAKHKLMAIWMTTGREFDLNCADVLFYLDEKWQEIYGEYRIKEGFSAAQLRANTFILSIIYKP